MNAYCMYCTKEIKEKNLNHSRDIVCPDCVQKLVGYHEKMPRKRPVSPATARKRRTVGVGKGNKSPTGVGE